MSVRSVADCLSCPFYLEALGDGPGCSEVDGLITADAVRSADGLRWVASSPPPEACPLRNGPVVVRLAPRYGDARPATPGAGA